MTDWISVHMLDGFGSVGLVVLFGFALARGWIRTDREHREVVHDRNEWRTESRIKDQQIAEKDIQLRYLTEVGEIQKHLLSEMQRFISRSQGDHR